MARQTQNASTTSFADEIDDAVLQELYSWVDQIPLSRPKKNLTRDFSDGVLVAETIEYYFPKLVELHNYPPATGTKLKIENWSVLNRKVFKKLHFELADDVIKQVVNCKPFVIERVLLMLRTKIDNIIWEKHSKQQNDQPEADQYKHGFTQQYYPHSANGTFVAENYPPYREPTPRKNQQTKKQTGTQPAARSGALTQHKLPPVANDGPGNKGSASLVPAEYVPRIQMEEKVQEVLSRDETIQILEAKVRRLEHLLHLKDIRINDLQSKVDGIRPTGVR